MDSARRADLENDLVANLAWVRRVALAIVRDDALADDVAQDVVWNALRRPPEPRPGSLGALRAWLSTQARRLALDRARSESTRRARERAVARPEADGGSSEAVDRGARTQRVVEAVMQLEEPYRSAVLMRYMDQLPMAEAARRLDVSETTLRKRLATGLERLRVRLDAEFGEKSDTWALALLGVRGSDAVPIAAAPASSAPIGTLAVVQGVLLMNAKWVAASVIVALIGLAVWLIPSQLDGGARALAGSDASSTSLGGLAAPESADAARTSVTETASSTASAPAASPSGPFLIVRSSIGLPLPFVDVQDERGDWRRADLVDHRCAIDLAIPFPRLVRAPGHAQKSATKIGEDLVLEPDALLTLEAKDLRTRTRTIRPVNHYEAHAAPLRPRMRQACAFGFLSDDKWCIAVSTDLVRAIVHDDEAFDVEILWPDHQRADVHLLLRAGARANWSVPVDRGAPGSPFRLHVARPPGEPAGDIVFKLVHAGYLDGKSSWAVTEKFEGGTAVMYPPENLWIDEMRLAAGQSDFELDFVPIGVELTLVGTDATTHAYGRLDFVHDGKARVLELHPAFVLKGCLRAADDGTPVTIANFVWEFRDSPESHYTWRSENFPLLTKPDGCFEARGPKSFSPWHDMPIEPPSKLRVAVDAPGFESFERNVDTGGARNFDCGEIALLRRKVNVVLAPGHGVTPKSIAYEQIWVSADPAVQWMIRGGSLEPDGSLSIFLDRTEESTKDEPRFETWRMGDKKTVGLPWPTEPSRWVTLAMIVEFEEHGTRETRDECWLFERQADGRYAPVPRREIELDVKLVAPPPDADQWLLGWSLHDQWGYAGVDMPTIVGEMTHVRFAIPAGAELWWRDGNDAMDRRAETSHAGRASSPDLLRGRVELK